MSDPEPKVRPSMLLEWLNNRKGVTPVERRLYWLLSVVQTMNTDEATTLGSEIEAFCKDLDLVAETMRGIVTTHRRIVALSATQGRTPEEAALFEAKVAEFKAKVRP